MALLRRGTPAVWYSVIVGAFLSIRAGTTLLSGASFSLPGDGWRALSQLVAVAVLAAGLSRRGRAPLTVIAVGVLYAFITAAAIASGHDVLGAIPVDARDRIVHPLLAVTAFGCGAISLARSPERSDHAAAVEDLARTGHGHLDANG